MSDSTKSPYFSICIPSYNLAHLIPDAIESVLDQSFGDFELLIQDDVSTDNIEDVLAKYTDPRISYERNTENMGIFANLNILCERAKGKYIKVLCADDILSKNCLKTVFDVLQDLDEEANLVALKETPDKSCLDKYHRVSELHLFTIDRNNLFRFLCEPDNWGGGLAELCVKRDYFQSRGFFGEAEKTMDFSKDIITWFEMVLDQGCLMINEPLVYQRPHAGQARYKLPRVNQLREMFEFFCDREGEFAKYKDFETGRKRYLERYIMSHYWYGIKCLMSGHGTDYLKQVASLKKQFNYSDFPWRFTVSKVLDRLIPIKA